MKLKNWISDFDDDIYWFWESRDPCQGSKVSNRWKTRRSFRLMHRPIGGSLFVIINGLVEAPLASYSLDLQNRRVSFYKNLFRFDWSKDSLVFRYQVRRRRRKQLDARI
jgi:hypothetical protein